MQPSEIKEDENINRRGSLAISALLNDSSAAAAGDSVGGGGSPILTSGTVSPVMGNATTANQLSKAKRKRISPAQYNRLMEIFDQTDTPSSEIRENLAEELDMTKREVQVWFQNRRAKMNRTKNQSNNNTTRHRHSLIPHSVSSITTNNATAATNSGYYQVKPRRASAALPILQNNYKQHQLQQQQPAGGHYPIAPTPSLLRQEYHPYHQQQPVYAQQQQQQQPQFPQHAYYHREQSKPSAIDLLASAAEIVRTDPRKELQDSRT